MTDVLIVCVREDEAQAKTLADLFEREGMSVGGAPSDEAALKGCGAAVVIWSQASIRSRPFLDAAQRVVNAGKAVIACLIDPPPASSLNQSPCFDLKSWNGSADDPIVDTLYFAVDRMVNAIRPRNAAPAPEPAPRYEPQAAAPTPPPRPNYAPAQNYAPQPAQTYAPSPPPYARARPAQPAQNYDQAPPPRRAPRQPPAEAAPRAAASGHHHHEPIDPVGAEALRWKAIRHSRDPAAFLHYLSEYGPDGAFSELAEMRLKQLEQSNATPLKAAARAVSKPQPMARREPPAPRREPPPPMMLQPEPDYEDDEFDPEPEFEAYVPPPPSYQASRRGGAGKYPPPSTEFRPPIERRGGGGGAGAIRFLFLFVLLGGGAVAAGMYFGAGQRPSGAQDAVAAVTDGDSANASTRDEPAPAAEEVVGSDTAVGGPTPIEEAQFDAPARAAPSPQIDRASRQFDNPRSLDREVERPMERAPTPTSAAAAAPPPPVRFEVMGGQSSVTPLLPPPLDNSQTQLASVTATPARPTIARAAEVVWQTRANADQFSAVYPQQARRASVAGRVQLNCVIQQDRSAACSVIGETPAGYGFGAAAMRVARYYRARGTLDDGSTSVGAQAALNITFRPSD